MIKTFSSFFFHKLIWHGHKMELPIHAYVSASCVLVNLVTSEIPPGSVMLEQSQQSPRLTEAKVKLRLKFAGENYETSKLVKNVFSIFTTLKLEKKCLKTI